MASDYIKQAIRDQRSLVATLTDLAMKHGPHAVAVELPTAQQTLALLLMVEQLGIMAEQLRRLLDMAENSPVHKGS